MRAVRWNPTPGTAVRPVLLAVLVLALAFACVLATPAAAGPADEQARSDRGAGGGTPTTRGIVDDLLPDVNPPRPPGSRPPASRPPGKKPSGKRRTRRAGGVRVARTAAGVTARVKALPVTRNPKRGMRSVLSLGARKLGKLKGGRLDTSGELQVSVCLAGHPNGCFGSSYPYNPKVKAYLALARRKGESRRRKLTRLTPTKALKCTQTQPARNHHCTLSMPRAKTKLPTKAGCAPAKCRINLIAGANHRKAGRRDKVVIGGYDGRRVDNKGEAKVSAALYYAGRIARKRRLRDRSPAQRRLPVSRVGEGPAKRVIYSIKIKRPRKGERLVVDGRYVGGIGPLPYNLRLRTVVLLAGSPNAVRPGKRVRKMTTGYPHISEESNFNCTRRASAHRSPCSIRKAGVIAIRRKSPKPVYVNLVAGNGAIGAGAERRQGSDRARVAGGFLKVRRHRGKECRAGGRYGRPSPGRCPKP